MIYKQLERNDLPKYLDHLLRLDPDSRYLRFGAPLSDAAIEHFIMTIERNFKDHRIYGAFNDEHVLGVAHLAFGDNVPEFGVSVDNVIRRQGHATHLVRMAITYLRNHGYREATMYCLSNNEPVMRLVRKLGAAAVTHGQDSTANVSIPLPTPGTVVEEFNNNVVLFVDKVLSQQESYMNMFFGSRP